ncbi:50S ribosomal protein L25/general stress protein Ctc [Propionibacteriaceae bacterium Y1700]|uniref:50S ribosomal protein L25/general stress protein Ctc n=1 Tax=Microlunatus sp. Y1700 TaxID=3418487 RepID=UPI003DA79E17
MAEVKLSAELRTEFGKGAARRTRREHKVPAVLYGHGADTTHITLPGHETLLALRVANALLSIEIEGEETRLAIPKQVQRDPLKGTIEHVDLLIVRRGEKVTVDVGINVTGEASPEALVMTENTSITVEAEATHIPTGFEVSVEGLEPGTQILAKDVALPEGTTLAVDEELLIVNVIAAPTQAELDAELAEAEAEAGIEATVDEDAESDGESGEGEGEESSEESSDE